MDAALPPRGKARAREENPKNREPASKVERKPYSLSKGCQRQPSSLAHCL
jgi:hypothetical protein